MEALTGIKLDHVIVFDFNSFRTMVDAIGGVTVCVPPGPGYHDGYSHLNLGPGLHKLSYNQALAYVRTRHGVGSGVDAGGDLPRIQLQQAFISSVSQQIEHQGLLSNISGLYKVANIATKALTVDQNLKSVSNLLHLAESLVHLKSKNINLITIPTQTDTYPGLSAHLMAVQPMDDLLYQMVRTGRIWHGGLPTEAPAKVKVKVENATGQSGLAGRTATSLRKLGFDVTGVGDAPATSATTVSFAGEEQSQAAYTLSKALKSFPAGQNTLAEPASQIGASGTITLILGTDFAGVNPLSAATQPKSGKASKKAKASNSSPGTAGRPPARAPCSPATPARASAPACRPRTRRARRARRSREDPPAVPASRRPARLRSRSPAGRARPRPAGARPSRTTSRPPTTTMRHVRRGRGEDHRLQRRGRGAAPASADRVQPHRDQVGERARRELAGVRPAEAGVPVGGGRAQQLGRGQVAAVRLAQPLVQLHRARLLEQVDHGVAVAAQRQRAARGGAARAPGRCRRPGRVRWSGTCRRRLPAAAEQRDVARR